MPRARSNSSKSDKTAANLDFAAKFGFAADKVRNTIGATEYKHVVLGRIFLNYISDASEEMRVKLAIRSIDGDVVVCAPLPFKHRYVSRN